MEIGQRLKRLRTKNRLTLEELANRSELTKGFLSQVERDLTSPSITTLNDIVEALGMTLGEFFKDEELSKKVFMEDDYFVLDSDTHQITWVIPNAQKNQMEPILLKLPVEGQSQTITPHEGEEFGYVLKGRVSLVLEDEVLTLKKGQTFYIDGSQSHYLTNISKSEAQILWVCTPPIF